MLVNLVMTKHYEQQPPLPAPTKQTQSKPIKPNFKGIKPLIIGFFSWYFGAGEAGLGVYWKSQGVIPVQNGRGRNGTRDF